jgi:hypothetical protein
MLLVIVSRCLPVIVAFWRRRQCQVIHSVIVTFIVADVAAAAAAAAVVATTVSALTAGGGMVIVVTILRPVWFYFSFERADEILWQEVVAIIEDPRIANSVVTTLRHPLERVVAINDEHALVDEW